MFHSLTLVTLGFAATDTVIDPDEDRQQQKYHRNGGQRMRGVELFEHDSLLESMFFSQSLQRVPHL